MSLFLASDVRLGGVVPFRSRPLSQLHPETSLLKKDSPTGNRVSLRRREIISSEESFHSRERVIAGKAQACKLKTPSGRSFREVGLSAFAILKDSGWGTLTLLADFGDHQLNLSEIVELASGMRGTSPNRGGHVTSCWSSRKFTAPSLGGIARGLLTHLCQSLDLPPPGLAEQQVIYPIAYLGNLLEIHDLAAVTQDNAKEFVVLSNLWDHPADLIKDREVNALRESEIHPFTYGNTYVSQHLALEVHTAADVQSIARFEGITVQSHHDQECLALTFLAEAPILHHFALTRLLTELDARAQAEQPSPSNLYRLLKHNFLLAKTQHKFAFELTQVRSLTKANRTYINKVNAIFGRALSLERLEAEVDRKLANLSGRINQNFTMIATLLTLFLTGIALVFALLSLFKR